jgi:hypothetical protein
MHFWFHGAAIGGYYGTAAHAVLLPGRLVGRVCTGPSLQVGQAFAAWSYEKRQVIGEGCGGAD